MTDQVVNDMLNEWINDKEDNTVCVQTNALIRYLDRHLYSTFPEVKSFLHRLGEWLSNVKGDDRRCLFEFVPNLFFVGPKEFESLQEAAFEESYTQWILSTSVQAKINSTSDFNSLINEELKQTAFTQLTDSMNISHFHHAAKMRIKNRKLNVTWHADIQVGTDRLKSSIDMLKNKNIKRLVILEDHVGSGSQLRKVLNKSKDIFDNFSVLVIPLLCGQQGYNEGKSLARKYNFSFRPVLVMNEHARILHNSQGQSSEILNQVKDVAENYKEMYVTKHRGKSDSIYGFADSGSLLVMHTNCPNNTMLFIRANTERWRPLFPRQGRHE